MHPSGFNEQDKIGKAKVMFLELEKKTFNFDHCWRVLRFHPKWVEHMEIVKLKKKPSSNGSTPNSINLGEDEDFHAVSSNLDRPIGRKVEKEKRKRKEMTESDSLVVLNEMKEIRKSKIVLMQEARDHDNKMLCLRQEEVSLRQSEVGLREEEMRIQKEKVLLEQEKLRIEEKKEDERIMALNTSTMPPMLQQYHLQRQMKILASRTRKN
ncbi:hypothetical protein F2P56_014831 [Juglans regia]|uniref:Uncharacterized protein LOC109010794 n=2 Tax=Juglans regia TaxID=51240 RepID=A0A2I4GTN4_JUGRE|nr:uncharacterized protein LOC109010794 [Juglans regia]KAF5464779.1 hypothetical protein F2P56_014831 [Juglans regia]